jgi:hypothetical protein
LPKLDLWLGLNVMFWGNRRCTQAYLVRNNHGRELRGGALVFCNGLSCRRTCGGIRMVPFSGGGLRGGSGSGVGLRGRRSMLSVLLVLPL